MDEIIYETIAEVPDPSVALVLITALRGYGFHPKSREHDGFPGVQQLLNSTHGQPIEVPESEATEARILARSLLADMLRDRPGGKSAARNG